MNVFRKIKDVLFDVEEELPTISEEKKEELPPKKPLEESTIKEVKVPAEELFKTKPLVTDTRFNFPIDVDEKPETRQRYNEYSTRETLSQNKYKSRDLTYDPLIRPKKTKPFKASPIISPVYGILDKNYSKDDVIVKTDIGVKGPNLDEVRKKAYGRNEEEGELKEEFDKSLKTLDAILMEESEEVIDKPEMTIEELPKKKEENTIPEEYAFITDAIKRETTKQNKKEAQTKKEEKLENTIESDLFNLIDSMYEDKESEEE